MTKEPEDLRRPWSWDKEDTSGIYTDRKLQSRDNTEKTRHHNTERGAILEAERPSLDIKFASASILNFPVSITMKRKQKLTGTLELGKKRRPRSITGSQSVTHTGVQWRNLCSLQS
ncbi:uncharacterized protein LOC128929807 isoform X2 [Callithrix jacchus]